ncbi:MAG: T9SS type A sorting domain-containing protein [Bacteroidales bacterium]|nr:T9SS type A sorting domain-containing protein [Bacteroidales bacterium]
MKKIFLGIVCVISFFINAFGQSVSLSGPTTACSNTEYVYGFGVSGTTCYYSSKQWTITGGTIISEAGNSATVKWDETTETHKISIKLFFPKECALTIPAVTKNVTVRSVLSGDMENIDVLDHDGKYLTSLTSCVDTTFWLETEPITEEVTSSSLSYYWYYSNGGAWKHFATSSQNLAEVSLYGKELAPGNKVKFKVEAYSVCESNKKTCDPDLTKDLKYCFESYGLNTVVKNPSCYDSTDATITINNIPDPEACVTFTASTEQDKDSIDFTISRYVKAPLDGDGIPYCNESVGSGGSDIPVNNIPGHAGDYCLTGYTTNYTFIYDDSTKTLTKNEIKLEDKFGNIIPGIDSGLYAIQIENPLFSPWTFYTGLIEAPPQLEFTADPVEIDGSEYHITTPGGNNGVVNLDISGGNEGSYYYNGTEINHNGSTYYITDINYGTPDIEIVDSKDCPSIDVTSEPWELLDPDELEIDTISTNRTYCHENDSVYDIANKSGGGIYFNVTGGIKHYFVDLVKDGEITPIASADINDENPHIFTNLDKGTYTLSVGDYNEDTPYQTDDIAMEIKQPGAISISFTDTIDPVCSPIADGKLVISASGGTPDYDLFELLDNTQAFIRYTQTDTITGIEANTTYFIKVEDDYDCYQLKEFNSGSYSNPLRFDMQELIPEKCLGGADGSILLHPYGGHNEPHYDNTNFKFTDDFNYYNNKNFVDSAESLVRLENLYSDSLYIFELEDNDGCIIEDTVFVTGYLSPLEINIVESVPEVCLGGADGYIKLQAGGGHQTEYLENHFSFTDQLLNEEILSDTTPGSYVYFRHLYSDSTYTVHLDDDKGCSESLEVFVTGYSSPLSFTKGLRIPPNCIGGDDGYIQLQGFGGHEGTYDDSYYELLNYSGEALSTQSPDITISNLFGDSIYTVTLGDKAGCSETDTIFLGEEPNPVQPLLLDSAEERCYEYKDGWIQVSGTSGEKPPGGYNYFLTNEDQFSMNPSDPKDTSIVKSGEDARFYNLIPGWHSIYISDENDCLNENIIANRNAYKTEFYVEAQDLLQYEYELHNSSTIGGADGYVHVILSGANDRYEYQIIEKMSLLVVESGKIGTGISDLGALKEGEYSLQFKDTCGCSNSNLEWINYDFNIIDPADSLGMDIIQINEPLCYGYSDGSVVVQGKDGWGFYEYGIDSVYSGNEDGILTGLPSGYHNVCVKDKEGAQYCELVYIDQPDTLLPVVEEITDVQCHNGSDGIVALDVMGGTMPYQYSSDDVNWQADSFLTGFSKGIYTLYIKDAHECKVSIEAELDHPELFTMDYSITNTICGETHGAIECTINGGTSPYNYSWFMVDTEGEHQIPDQTAIAGNLAGGKYKLYLNDAHLCDTSWVFIVNNTDGPELTINSFDHVSCSGMVNGAIHYTIEQGVAPYYVELQSGAEVINTIVHENTGTYSFTALADGYYRVMVRDANPCVQSSEELSIEVPNPVIISLNTLIHPICYGDANGQISVHTEGGNGSYVYQWSIGETGNSISNLISGSYTVTATDAKGCYDESTYEIVDPEQLTVEIGDEETLCEGQTYPLFAEGFATYNWVYNGETISSASEIEVWAAGEYTLYVTDENGCQADDSFILSISNDLLEAEFLMPSEANVNDTVVAIDISWPEPENVVWSFSSGIININSEDYLETFTFENPGTYTVSITSYKAMCVDSVSKQIVVLADTSSMEKSFLGANPLIKYFNVFPNPNDGKFSVQVELEYNTGITVDLFNVQQNRLVFRQKGNGQSYYSMEYGFTNLQQGVYLVILYVENEKRVERIIIF